MRCVTDQAAFEKTLGERGVTTEPSGERCYCKLKDAPSRGSTEQVPYVGGGRETVANAKIGFNTPVSNSDNLM